MPSDIDAAEAVKNLSILVVAILANAFFAASEIAVISLNDAKIRRDAEGGDRVAALLRALINEPGRFLATLQVGVTLAGFLASAFAAVTFAKPLADVVARQPWCSLGQNAVESISTVLVTVVLAFLTIVFGELVPKRVAMKHSESLARFAVRPLRLFAKAAHPFVSLLNFTTNRILRPFGISAQAEKERVSEEEIRMMTDIASESGTIEPQEMEMIENVFEFNNKTADEIMVHRKDIVALPIGAEHEEIRQVIIESGLSRIPVYRETIDDILGILHTRDYLVAAIDGKKTCLSDLMGKPLFVPETIPADKLFRKMQKLKHSIAVVLDEHGGTSGIVTVEDLLEEIVGEMYDEHDSDTEPVAISKISDTEFRMPGEIEIGKVAEELDAAIEEGDFNTIGGYIFEKLNSVPSEGTVLEVPEAGLEFCVEKMDGHRIESVIARKASAGAADNGGGAKSERRED